MCVFSGDRGSNARVVGRLMGIGLKYISDLWHEIFKQFLLVRSEETLCVIVGHYEGLFLGQICKFTEHNPAHFLLK